MKRTELNAIKKEFEVSAKFIEEVKAFGLKVDSDDSCFKDGIPQYITDIITSTLFRFSKRRKSDVEYYEKRPFLIEEDET